jgi:hypothetical protein
LHLRGWTNAHAISGRLDGGDLEITIAIREITALEGPFLAGRASRKRKEDELARLEEQESWDDDY